MDCVFIHFIFWWYELFDCCTTTEPHQLFQVVLVLDLCSSRYMCSYFRWSRINTIVKTAVTGLCRIFTTRLKCVKRKPILWKFALLGLGLLIVYLICGYVGSITPCSQLLNYQPNTAALQHFSLKDSVLLFSSCENAASARSSLKPLKMVRFKCL